jgi:hypothetical protein
MPITTWQAGPPPFSHVSESSSSQPVSIIRLHYSREVTRVGLNHVFNADLPTEGSSLHVYRSLEFQASLFMQLRSFSVREQAID